MLSEQIAREQVIEALEPVIRDLIADVVALREQLGDHPSIKALERKLGKMLPPVAGRFTVVLPSDSMNWNMA